MPNPKITLNDMRVVVEALEQRMQTLEAKIKNQEQIIQKLNQYIQFGRI